MPMSYLVQTVTADDGRFPKWFKINAAQPY
jgi:hypothetical protein